MATSSSSSSRKRQIEELDEEEDRKNEEDLFPISFDAYSPTFTLENAKVTPTDREKHKFDRVTLEAQKSCIKAVSRLFLFKGSRQENVTRKNVSDVLNEIDPDYKTHVNAVVALSQQFLYETCGYLIVPANSIKQLPNAKKDLYFVTSTLSQTSLKKILAQAPVTNHAYFAFLLVTFHGILSTSGNKIACKDLLRCVRKVDARFPDTISSRSAGRSVAPVPELELDFMGLLDKMQKEGHITMTADELDPVDEGKKIVEFGPRFYVELGKKRLLQSYFRLTGQPVDEAMVREMENEEKALMEDQGEDEQS